MTDKYPSWREALFGSDAVANLRCAAKYLVWHGGYLLVALAGVLFYSLATLVDLVFRDNPVGRRVSTALESDRAAQIGQAGFLVVTVTLLATAVSFILYSLVIGLLTNPVGFVIGVGVAIVLIALVHISYTYEKRFSKALRVAGTRAVQTPGIRRIYGECPVSMSIQPKWYEGIFGDESDD